MKHSHPKKSLGQNFLIDKNYQNKIIQSVKSVYQGQPILEIGPGRGAITEHLLEFAQKIILVEKDNALAELHTKKYSERKNVTVYQSDFLDFDLKNVPDHTIVVSNLPYNVASQILIRLFENKHQFESLFLMFQKEVARRCVSQPGNKEYGILSVWTQLFSQAEILFDLPPTVFLPQPKVTSSFVKFVLNDKDFLQHKDLIVFVKKLFTHRRKKISTILKAQKILDVGAYCDMPKIKDLIDKRAEQLSIEDFKKLYGLL